MTTPKQVNSSKKRVAKNKKVDPKKRLPIRRALLYKVRRAIEKTRERMQRLVMRRPHRSFHHTRRRDYIRPLNLPGYWSFTNYVRKTLWQHKKVFFGLALVYGALTLIFIGIGSQSTYTQLGNLLRSTSGNLFQGDWGQVGQATLLLAAGVSGDLNTNLTDVQRVTAGILVLYTWLASVWLLRAIVSGRTPKLRDGIYNSGSPVVSTFLVALVGVLQLFPVAVVMLGISAAISSGLFDGGVEAMVFWITASLLVLLSLYWLTSTFMALIIVTLPGMYPMKAIQIAGDLVIGRRLRIMFRLIWLLLITGMFWIVVMVPIIIFDSWIKGVLHNIQNIPIVPVALLCISTLTLVWAASYIYLLYRKVVDDDTAPV